MAKNQQQQNNIKEQIFETVTTIVDEGIKDLGYNITKIGVITNADEAKRHKYKVKCGSLEMNVIDDNRTGNYKVDDVVRITIPNGNYNAKKVIEGLYSAGSEEDTIYVQPKNYFVSMTNQYKSNDYTIDLSVANHDLIEKQLIFSIGSTDDYFTFNNTEIFNSIYLKFKHSYQTSMKLISGEFQINLELIFSNENKNKIYSFSSLQLVGDPYSSIGFTNDVMFFCGNLSDLQAVYFSAFIPEESYHFKDENKNDVTEGLIQLSDIGIEFGHKYIDQTGIKLYTDDSIEYGREAGDYVKHLKYIWYNVDENNNFLGFEKGNFNTDFDFETIVKNKQLNEIYQNILNNNPNAEEFYGDEAGLDLRFNYDEIVKLQPGFLSTINNLKNQINELSVDFRKQWLYTNTDSAQTPLDMWLSDTQNDVKGSYINFWLTQAQAGVGDIIKQWNWELSEGTTGGHGNLIKKLKTINSTFFSAQDFQAIVNEVQVLSIKGGTDKNTSGTLAKPEKTANSYFQLSHIYRSDSNIGPGEIIVTSDAIENGWLPAENILEKMRILVYMMKRGVLQHVIGACDDDETVVNKLWESQTFMAYDKTEYIKSYFEPINNLEKRISYLENQIDVFNEKVKIYKSLREFLLQPENIISDKTNLCVQLSEKLIEACAESAKIFNNTENIDLNLLLLNLSDKENNWFANWKTILQSLMLIGLDLKTEYDSKYSIPEGDTYKIYVMNGIGILSSIESIQKYINLFTDLGFTTNNKAFQIKYEEWLENTSKSEWEPYPIEIPKNALDIKLFQSNEEVTNVNIWLNESGWEEVGKNDKQYWPVKIDNDQIQYFSTRFFPISIGLKNNLQENVLYNIDATQKEKQSFQVVILYNEQIIKSNVLTFDNYSNYNVFSQIPYLRINKIDSDFALSRANYDLMEYKIVGYEKDKVSEKTHLYNYEDQYYPKIKVSYGEYGIASQKSDELLAYQMFKNLEGDFTMKVNLHTKKISPLENYLFSIICLSIFYEDDVEHRITIPIPLATHPDLEMDGPKMIIFKQNGEVVFDTERTYTVFNKNKIIDENSLNYSVVLVDRYTGAVEKNNSYMYVDENKKLQVLTDYNTLASYLPILEVTGSCQEEDADFEYFIYRHPLLFTTDKSLKENYGLSNLSTILTQNQNNIYGSSVSNTDGVVNFSHSYIQPEKNQSSSTYSLRNSNNNNEELIKKGVSEIKSTFPYFTFFSDSINGLFEINLENEAPLRLLKGKDGIEFCYDGTIKILKENLEPIIFNYDTLNKLQKILEGSDIK